jgi:hypothetical protein
MMNHSTTTISNDKLWPVLARGSTGRATDSAADAARRLQRIRWLATLLDTSLRVPGTRIRFGLDSLAGLLPAVGDTATALLSVYLVYEAKRLGVSKRTLVKMMLNVAMDLGLGSVPVAGDVFDFFYKANKRNVQLLEAELKGK